jgi:Sulfatase-modifying factor enzyme 1/Sel1 repeat
MDGPLILKKSKKSQSLAIMAFIAILGSLSLFAQTPSELEKFVDSDGDGVSDAQDSNPLVAEVRLVSWRISPMTVGWTYNATLDENKTVINEQEERILSEKEHIFGKTQKKGKSGEFHVQSDIESNVQAKFTLNPLKLFGLKLEAGARGGLGGSFQAQFATSSTSIWNDTDRSSASDLSRLLSQSRIAKRLSDMHLEFTVEFFNYSDEDFIGQDLQIPVKVGDQVVTEAQAHDFNGPVTIVRIPAHRDRAIPMRYRARLDTTQSLALLKAMEQRSPTVSIEETRGAIINKDGNLDAVSAPARIRRKTCEITVEADGTEYTWMVARKNEQSNKPLTLSDAFDALNQLAAEKAEGKGKLFFHSKEYLRSAFGHDCEIDPVRWWVITPAQGSDQEQDVDPSRPLPVSLRLRQRLGFPDDMKRWTNLVNPTDVHALLVTSELLAEGIGGLARDEKKAVELWHTAADLGEPWAFNKLVSAYMKGTYGLPKDEKKGIELLQKAADLSDRMALNELGMVYLSGKGGLGKDEKKGIELLQKAADLGDARALNALGWAYIEGSLGLVKDEKKGNELLRKVAELTGRFINSLGMAFLPVAGTDVLFCEHETRIKDYAVYAAANPRVDMKWNDYEYSVQTSENPVENVSWEDAKAFCQWLSAKEGKSYRLPTDHEWSVAVGIGGQEDPTASPEDKQGKITGYPWGNTWPPPKGAGHFDRKSSYSDSSPFTAPVKSYNVGKHGLYDLSGNVWEWCEDLYSKQGGSRVLRGGSWYSSSELNLRSSSRYSDLPTKRVGINGFRCVVSAASCFQAE